MCINDSVWSLCMFIFDLQIHWRGIPLLALSSGPFFCKNSERVQGYPSSSYMTTCRDRARQVPKIKRPAGQSHPWRQLGTIEPSDSNESQDLIRYIGTWHHSRCSVCRHPMCIERDTSCIFQQWIHSPPMSKYNSKILMYRM